MPKKKVQFQIWKYRLLLKLFNRSRSPDLIQHRQHRNRPQFTFWVQYWIKQEVVHTRVKKKKKKIPTANVTKHKKPIRYHQWKAIWFMQPVLLYLNPPPVVHRPWDKAQDAKHNPLSQGIKKTNEKTYWFCATTIKTTDVCVCLSLCVWNQWPPLQIPPASSCKKCR